MNLTRTQLLETIPAEDITELEAAYHLGMIPDPWRQTAEIIRSQMIPNMKKADAKKLTPEECIPFFWQYPEAVQKRIREKHDSGDDGEAALLSYVEG